MDLKILWRANSPVFQVWFGVWHLVVTAQGDLGQWATFQTHFKTLFLHYEIIWEKSAWIMRVIHAMPTQFLIWKHALRVISQNLSNLEGCVHSIRCCDDGLHNGFLENLIVQKKLGFKIYQKCSPPYQVIFHSNHQVSYTKLNLNHLAISRSKDFMIHPLLTEKRVSLLVTGTLGHSV